MKSITDNVHGLINISQKNIFIWDLIHTKEFSRLSRIKQLGLVYLLYPSATHTRKSHSLGVYESARKALLNFNHKISDFTEKSILAAALLHDIGHGPMSHLFETVSVKSHEYYSSKIILDQTTQINKILFKLDKKLPQAVSDIILKKNKTPWIKSLISSDVDVDRMDYLVRDSIETGTRYGKINLDYLISNMLILKEKLIFSYKAIDSLEDFLISRHHLNSTVYFHKKNLAFQALLTMFYKRMIYLKNQNYQFKMDINTLIPVLNKKELTVDQFFKLDDYLIWHYISQALEEKDKILYKICFHLINNKLPKIIDISNSKLPTLEKKMENFTWTIASKSKSFSSWKEKPQEQAFIFDENNKIISIGDYSSIVKSLNQELSKIKTKKYLIKI